MYEEIKRGLLAKKKELIERKQRMVEEDPFSDPDARLSNNAAVDADAAEQFGHETSVAVLDEVDRKLAEVDRALVRIDSGEYGTCSGCGVVIDVNRLTVEPTAEYCVECQRKKVVVAA